MKNKQNVALIVGATGVVGRNLLIQLLRTGGWKIVTVSRRKPDVPGEYHHIAADLLDAASVRRAAESLPDVTHVFYSAYIEKDSWAAMVAPNIMMLRNLMEALEPVAAELCHVHLMQGTKWYGSHLGPFKTPAEESDPRHMPPNFYYDQQAYIEHLQRGKQWTWSAARPHGICGFALGNPMNLVMVLAVYASISKALGLPLRHPGSEANANSLYNVTDSGLLARASIWMATTPEAANEPFNITNGDIFRWRYIWPYLSRYFEMDIATPQKIDLVHMMADKGPVWEGLVEKHGLQPIPYSKLVSWAYGNFVFSPDYDIISSTVKARRYGFTEMQDSASMFTKYFDELRKNKIIP